MKFLTFSSSLSNPPAGRVPDQPRGDMRPDALRAGEAGTRGGFRQDGAGSLIEGR